MVAFCKDCRYLCTRDVAEMVAEAERTLRETGVPTAAYWGCTHPASNKYRRWGVLSAWWARLRKRNPPFVSCEQMRVYGAPCLPDGVLFEARDDG